MIATRPLVTRFAPSPTGFLHLGHAHSALSGWRRARQAGGRFLLRIEDIDTARCKPHFKEAIEEDLSWLGLDWDGPVRVQSQHFPSYQACLTGLQARGLLYPCFCTRRAIAEEIARSGSAPQGPDGPLYPGTCLRLSESERQDRLRRGEPHAMRLDMSAALAFCRAPLRFDEEAQACTLCQPGRFGDVVLGRKEVPGSYHLCVTHDDALDEVTLVTRGNDLRPATDLHVLLQALMGWPQPSYAHHPLLVDEKGRRLAKRDGAPALRDMRAGGISAAKVRAMAGWPD